LGDNTKKVAALCSIFVGSIYSLQQSGIFSNYLTTIYITDVYFKFGDGSKRA